VTCLFGDVCLEVDCDEQTRPWSTGQCDGQTSGQDADQLTQRRQSGQSVYPMHAAST